MIGSSWVECCWIVDFFCEGQFFHDGPKDVTLCTFSSGSSQRPPSALLNREQRQFRSGVGEHKLTSGVQRNAGVQQSLFKDRQRVPIIIAFFRDSQEGFNSQTVHAGKSACTISDELIEQTVQ